MSVNFHLNDLSWLLENHSGVLDNRLFELNTTLKHELTDLKLQNQKLVQDNLELLKSPGSGAGSGGVGVNPDKLRTLEEQLFKTKDEVIDLQKKLVDVEVY